MELGEGPKKQDDSKKLWASSFPSGGKTCRSDADKGDVTCLEIFFLWNTMPPSWKGQYCQHSWFPRCTLQSPDTWRSPLGAARIYFQPMKKKLDLPNWSNTKKDPCNLILSARLSLAPFTKNSCKKPIKILVIYLVPQEIIPHRTCVQSYRFEFRVTILHGYKIVR